MIHSVRQAWELLDQRSKRILLLLVFIQILLASLDLLGVLLLGVVAALSASATTGVVPDSLAPLIGRLNFPVEEALLAIGVGTVAGIVLIAKSILSFFLVRRTLKFLANRQAVISSQLAAQMLARPLLFVQRRTSQESAFALTVGVNSATLGILGNAVVMAAEIAVLIVLAGALLFLDPLVAIFALLFFSALGLTLYRAMGNWARRLGARLSSTEIASTAAVQDSIRTYREMTVSGRRGFLIKRFRDLRWQAATVQADSQVMAQVPKYVFEVALILGGALLAVSQVLTRDLIAAVSIIAVFLAAGSRILPSLLRMQQAALSIRTSGGVAERTFQLREELASAQDQTMMDPAVSIDFLKTIRDAYPAFNPEVSLESVCLVYPGSATPAVQDFTLSVKAGESLALVGPTGAGKSSVADMILGVVAPSKGCVRLGNLAPIRAITHWPGAIAYVPQEIAVVSGSIRDNVALGLPPEYVDDELVWEALERARLAESLASSREGLETVVGEHGVRLSGGQRQRLGLARALYTRPRLIVLDEATSALDAETEDAISRALTEMEGSVTLVIIAHRLATIRYSNHVVYMEKGQMRAFGTFEEVRNLQPNFDRQAKLLGL